MPTVRTAAVYPRRPKFYANKFVRLLAKACVANDHGPEVFTLLTVVAFTEDARGYRGSVGFFNGQLRPLIGCGSDDALNRVRKKAVDAGWLVYVPGGKSRPGRYHVTTPDGYANWDDNPTDEGVDRPDLPPQNCGTKPRESAAQTAGEANLPPQNCGTKPRESADHSSLYLFLSSARAPDDPPEGAEEKPAGEVVEGIPSLKEFVAAWNGAGLTPRTASSTLRGYWQNAWRNFPGFRERWRAAVAHAGRQPRCRPGGAFPLTPEFLLRNETAVERVLSGEFDERPGRTPAAPRDYVKDF